MQFSPALQKTSFGTIHYNLSVDLTTWKNILGQGLTICKGLKPINQD